MRVFGIEIRKSGTIKSLYSDVDHVLKTAGLENGGVSKSIKRDSLAHSLQRMMEPNGYFSICTINRCMELGQVIISQERYRIYDAMHCVYWRAMEPNYRTTLIAMILDDFREILLYAD